MYCFKSIIIALSMLSLLGCPSKRPIHDVDAMFYPLNAVREDFDRTVKAYEAIGKMGVKAEKECLRDPVENAVSCAMAQTIKKEYENVLRPFTKKAEVYLDSAVSYINALRIKQDQDITITEAEYLAAKLKVSEAEAVMKEKPQAVE